VADLAWWDNLQSGKNLEVMDLLSNRKFTNCCLVKLLIPESKEASKMFLFRGGFHLLQYLLLRRGRELFLLHRVQTGSEAHTVIYPTCTRGKAA